MNKTEKDMFGGFILSHTTRIIQARQKYSGNDNLYFDAKSQLMQMARHEWGAAQGHGDVEPGIAVLESELYRLAQETDGTHDERAYKQYGFMKALTLLRRIKMLQSVHFDDIEEKINNVVVQGQKG